MATTTADLLIDRLLEWGVSMIFGRPQSVGFVLRGW